MAHPQTGTLGPGEGSPKVMPRTNKGCYAGQVLLHSARNSFLKAKPVPQPQTQSCNSQESKKGDALLPSLAGRREDCQVATDASFITSVLATRDGSLDARKEKTVVLEHNSKPAS